LLAFVVLEKCSFLRAAPVGQKVRIGVGQQVDTTDFHVEAIDLLGNHVPCEAGIAFVVAIWYNVTTLMVIVRPLQKWSFRFRQFANSDRGSQCKGLTATERGALPAIKGDPATGVKAPFSPMW
jgi:N6-adenosine-specific RNA methylase IME4